MKRLLLSIILLCSGALLVADGCCNCRTSAQTFFSIRPPFQVSSPERLAHFRDDRVEARPCGWLGAIQVVPFGGEMVENADMARYFLPFCKNVLTVNEAALTQPPVGTDIIAEHLNIYTVNRNFSSKCCFIPHHSFAGVGFYWQQEVYHTKSGRAVWFSISVPIENVRNRIDIQETIISNGGGILPGPTATGITSDCGECGCVQSDTLPIPRVDSVVAAFAQPGWCFGKIFSGKTHSITKVVNVELRAALQIANNEHSHLESWAGILIPTGNVPKGEIVFEPIAGNNDHWAAILGSSFGVHVWENECRSLSIYSEFDFNIQYFFERNEVRAVDLAGKPWSRYMQFYDLNQATLASTGGGGTNVAFTIHTPGINLLTRELKIKPGYARTFNAAYDILYKDIEFEAGYNFYARQAECGELACGFANDVALKSLEMGDGTTDNAQLINNNFANDCLGVPFDAYMSNLITANDLDLDSAAVPAYLTHTLYASVAYDWQQCRCPIPFFTSIGGSYEFPSDNTGMNRWMIFGKIGVSF